MKKFSANISARLTGRKTPKAPDIEYATMLINLNKSNDFYKPGDEIKGEINLVKF